MNNVDPIIKPFRPRSFVRRNSRQTVNQEQARLKWWSTWGLEVEQGLVDYQQLYGRVAPCFLEVGFGSGQSLLALAKSAPEKNFIGIETHTPGIGALFLGIELNQLSNIRVYEHDAVEVLEKCISPGSLDGVQIFFPDPWPKRRHHPRRLIQTSFVSLLVTALKVGGVIHLATDWKDYAVHMMRVLSQEKRLINSLAPYEFSERSIYRPLITKFEQRAIRENRPIWELQFAVIA